MASAIVALIVVSVTPRARPRPIAYPRGVFATTFLGHQGWMVRGNRAAILIDPLLREDFGDLQAMSYRVFPPRVFTDAAFPPIHAVVLSHEHDDHFDIPSLARLDRKIPIYLSVRSSSAAHDVLAAMGFTVHPLVPGGAARVGDLDIIPFAGDHVSVNCGEEWDTLPYLIRSADGHGSLFSMVDIPITERHVAWAAEKTARPGLVTWTNNSLDWSHMASYLRDASESTQQFFMTMGVGHKLISTVWGVPAAMLLCAGGFYFHGDKAWMNERVFSVDNEAIGKLMTQVYKKEKFIAATPGQTFTMQAQKLKSIEPSAPWLSTVPRDSWPIRGRRDVAPADYSPATGRTAITPDELHRIAARLTDFAGSLVGGDVFKGLHSLLVSELPDRKPTFAFVVRSGDTGATRHAFEYVPTRCDFAPAPSDAAEARYLAGFECWATDLLAVLDGNLGPIALSFGRAHLWNALPSRFHFDLFTELYRISHPLRRPAEYAKLYERAWRAVADTVPTIRAASG